MAARREPPSDVSCGHSRRAADLAAKLRPIKKLPKILFLFAHVVRSTALHWASYYGKLGAVNLFLERGAWPDSTNHRGMTPLHLAAIGGHDDVCIRLLAAGATPSMKDHLGRTAHAYATKLGHQAVRQKLLLAGRGTARV